MCKQQLLGLLGMLREIQFPWQTTVIFFPLKTFCLLLYFSRGRTDQELAASILSSLQLLMGLPYGTASWHARWGWQTCQRHIWKNTSPWEEAWLFSFQYDIPLRVQESIICTTKKECKSPSLNVTCLYSDYVQQSCDPDGMPRGNCTKNDK